MSDIQTTLTNISLQALELQRWQDDGGRCFEQGVPSDAQIVVEAAHMMSDLAVRPAEMILSAFGQPGYGRGFSERVLFDVAGEIAENYDYFELLSYEQARRFVSELVARGIRLVWESDRKLAVR